MRSKWRLLLQDPELRKAKLLHFLKYSSVGTSGVPVNALIFSLACQITPAWFATFFAFVAAGQYVFWLQNWKVFQHHKALRPVHRLLLFNLGNTASAVLNLLTFSQVHALGATRTWSYVAAMIVSVPCSYLWNNYVVHRPLVDEITSTPEPEPVEMNE